MAVAEGSGRILNSKYSLLNSNVAISIRVDLTSAKPVFQHSRSGFKIPDWVQGQGVRPIGKAQHTLVCEHLPEVCNAAIGPKMGF